MAIILQQNYCKISQKLNIVVSSFLCFGFLVSFHPLLVNMGRQNGILKRFFILFDKKLNEEKCTYECGRSSLSERGYLYFKISSHTNCIYYSTSYKVRVEIKAHL